MPDMTAFGPLKITEYQYVPTGPLRLVGLEPGPERKVRVIDVESLEHALFVIQEGEDKGAFVPVWLESGDGFIVCAAEQLYGELRKRQVKIMNFPEITGNVI